MLTRSQIGALGSGSFVMATSMLIVTGMLVEMAQDLGLPVTVAGQLVAAAPLMLALASPTLALTTSAFSRRTLLIWGAVITAASHFLAAASDSFAMLLVARALTGLGAACFMPQTAATAVVLAPANQGGRMLALVFVGYGVANSVGLPVGTWLGAVIGWRATLVIIGLISLAVGAWVWRALPAKIAQAPLRAASMFDVARDLAIVTSIGVGLLQSLAQFTVFAYIAPSLRESLGGGASTTAFMLAVYGVSGIVGSFITSRIADRLGPVRIIFIAIGLMMAALLAWSLGRGSYPLTLLAMVFWGLGNMPIPSALPVRLIALNPSLASASISFNNTASFGGAAIGTVIGARMIEAFGYVSLGWVGIGVFVLCLAMLSLSQRMSHGRISRR